MLGKMKKYILKKNQNLRTIYMVEIAGRRRKLSGEATFFRDVNDTRHFDDFSIKYFPSRNNFRQEQVMGYHPVNVLNL